MILISHAGHGAGAGRAVVSGGGAQDATPAAGVLALAERARGQGATEPEITETVRMAFFCGGMPTLVTATSVFRPRS